MKINLSIFKGFNLVHLELVIYSTIENSYSLEILKADKYKIFHKLFHESN